MEKHRPAEQVWRLSASLPKANLQYLRSSFRLSIAVVMAQLIAVDRRLPRALYNHS